MERSFTNGPQAPARTPAPASKGLDAGLPGISPEERSRRLDLSTVDLAEAMSRFECVQRSASSMRLQVEATGTATMKGGQTGVHTITQSDENSVQWVQRIAEHWAGYIEANGVELYDLSPLPTPPADSPSPVVRWRANRRVDVLPAATELAKQAFWADARIQALHVEFDHSSGAAWVKVELEGSADLVDLEEPPGWPVGVPVDDLACIAYDLGDDAKEEIPIIFRRGELPGDLAGLNVPEAPGERPELTREALSYREIAISSRVTLALNPTDSDTPAMVWGKTRVGPGGRVTGEYSATYACATETGVLNDSRGEMALTQQEMKSLASFEDLECAYNIEARKDCPEYS